MKIAEAKPPSKKYLSAASEEVERCRRRRPVRTDDRKDLESKKMTMRSFAWVISSAPDRGEREDVNSTPETRSRIAQSWATNAVMITSGRSRRATPRSHRARRRGDRDRRTGLGDAAPLEVVGDDARAAAAMTVNVATPSGTLPAPGGGEHDARAAPKKIRTGRIAR